MTSCIKKGLTLVLIGGLVQEPLLASACGVGGYRGGSASSDEFQAQALAPVEISNFFAVRNFLSRGIPSFLRLLRSRVHRQEPQPEFRSGWVSDEILQYYERHPHPHSETLKKVLPFLFGLDILDALNLHKTLERRPAEFARAIDLLVLNPYAILRTLRTLAQPHQNQTSTDIRKTLFEKAFGAFPSFLFSALHAAADHADIIYPYFDSDDEIDLQKLLADFSSTRVVLHATDDRSSFAAERFPELLGLESGRFPISTHGQQAEGTLTVEFHDGDIELFPDRTILKVPYKLALSGPLPDDFTQHPVILDLLQVTKPADVTKKLPIQKAIMSLQASRREARFCTAIALAAAIVGGLSAILLIALYPKEFWPALAFLSTMIVGVLKINGKNGSPSASPGTDPLALFNSVEDPEQLRAILSATLMPSSIQIFIDIKRDQHSFNSFDEISEAVLDRSSKPEKIAREETAQLMAGFRAALNASIAKSETKISPAPVSNSAGNSESPSAVPLPAAVSPSPDSIKKPFAVGTVVRIKPEPNQKEDPQLYRIDDLRVNRGFSLGPQIAALLTPVKIKDGQIVAQKGLSRSIDVMDLKEILSHELPKDSELLSDEKPKSGKKRTRERKKGLTGSTSINQEGMIDIWSGFRSGGYQFAMSQEENKQHLELRDNKGKLLASLQSDLEKDQENIKFIYLLTGFTKNALNALLIEALLHLWKVSEHLATEPPTKITFSFPSTYYGWIKRWETTGFVGTMSNVQEGSERKWSGHMRWDWVSRALPVESKISERVSVENLDEPYYLRLKRLAIRLESLYDQDPALVTPEIHRLLSENPDSRRGLWRSIKAIDDGGAVRPEYGPLRDMIWNTLLADRFGDRTIPWYRPYTFRSIPEHYAALPQLPRQYNEIAEKGHIAIRGTVPPSGEINVGKYWCKFASVVGQDFILEMDRGYPLCIWFDGAHAVHDFFSVDAVIAEGQFHSVLPEKVSPKLLQSIKHGTMDAQLDGLGQLYIGGGRPYINGNVPGKESRRPWGNFDPNLYPFERLRLYIEDGLIVKCDFLDSDLTIHFAKIWSKFHQRYTTVFWHVLSQEDARNLTEDNEIHSYHLAHVTHIWLGGILRFIFPKHYIGRFITLSDIRNPTGTRPYILKADVLENGQIIESRQLSQIYTASEDTGMSFQKKKLVDVFDNWSSALAQGEDGRPLGTYIVRTHLGSNGDLHLTPVRRPRFPHFPNAEIEVKIQPDGRSYIKFLFDADNIPILDDSGNPVIFELSNKTSRRWPFPKQFFNMSWVKTLRTWQTVDLPDLVNKESHKIQNWLSEAFRMLTQVAEDRLVPTQSQSAFHKLLRLQAASNETIKILGLEFPQALSQLLKIIDSTMQDIEIDLSSQKQLETAA